MSEVRSEQAQSRSVWSRIASALFRSRAKPAELPIPDVEVEVEVELEATDVEDPDEYELVAGSDFDATDP